MCSPALVLANYMVTTQHDGGSREGEELHTTPCSPPPLASYTSAVEQGTATIEYEKNGWSQVGNVEGQSHTGSSTVKKTIIKSSEYRNSFDVPKFRTLPPSSGAVSEMGLICTHSFFEKLIGVKNCGLVLQALVFSSKEKAQV